MHYLPLAYIHLGTVFPSFLIGAFLLVSRKGTGGHKVLGKTYMFLMLVTALITLFMPAVVGPTFLSHFGLIHLFSLLVLYSVPSAFFAIRNGNITRHKYSMLGVYCGGILIAGAFAFMPGRLLYDWVFS